MRDNFITLDFASRFTLGFVLTMWAAGSKIEPSHHPLPKEHTMKVWMIWQGGSSYAPSDISDTEEFASLGAAVAEFAHRASGTDPYYPCVEGSSGHLFLADPRNDVTRGDIYPDRIVEVGPRGGIRLERV